MECTQHRVRLLKVSNEDLKRIRRSTINGEKYFSNFIVEIKDEDDELVAKVKKTIYVRRKSMIQRIAA